MAYNKSIENDLAKINVNDIMKCSYTQYIPVNINIIISIKSKWIVYVLSKALENDSIVILL